MTPAVSSALQPGKEALMQGIPTQGVCQLCKETFGKIAMTRHLQRCVLAHDPPGAGKDSLFHLIIEGYGHYWLHVEMPGKAVFGNLDQFLRQIWLECCGHLSAFQMKDSIFDRLGLSRDWSFDSESPGEQLMDYEIAEVLEPKFAFGYEYDFGSTTHLKLKVAGMRIGKWRGKDQVRLLARNLAPDLKCGHCGAPATLIDASGYDGDFFCAKCAKQADDEEMLLPVVNSPRMGVCGYTG
jgi:hypothetical protein